MQESFEILASSGSYRVTLKQGLLETLLNDQKNQHSVFMIDQYLQPDIAGKAQNILPIRVSEQAKSLHHIPPLIEALRAMGVTRQTRLIAIGGGVIQDMATFCASIYMRGIAWSYVPTTLLGMLDSCIGGKSSINVGEYKNLIGNFYPPEQILIDPNFAKTLTEEQIAGGYFESVKICYARNSDAFSQFMEISPDLDNPQAETLTKLIYLSLNTKKWFIETDEFDRNERLLLNFGHTFGHAIEAGTAFLVSHGIAVGIGIIVAVEFSRVRQQLNPGGQEQTRRLTDYIIRVFQKLDKNVSIPDTLNIKKILEKFESDKKHHQHQYRIVCPVNEGQLAIQTFNKSSEVRGDIENAYRSAFAKIAWPCQE